MSGALPLGQADGNRQNMKAFESETTRKVRKSIKAPTLENSTPPSETQHAKDRHDGSVSNPRSAFGWSQDELAGSPESTRDAAESPRFQHADKMSQTVSPDIPQPTASRPTQRHVSSTTKPASGQVPATPSFINLANFKRRPRQPSLLSMVQRAESSSSKKRTGRMKRTTRHRAQADLPCRLTPSHFLIPHCCCCCCCFCCFCCCCFCRCRRRRRRLPLWHVPGALAGRRCPPFLGLTCP